jgi:long-chain acyl-CoA synthetase
MPADLEFYRRDIRIATQPPLHLSAIDIAPDYAQRTLVFVHGFGGQAIQWQYQLWKFSETCRVIAPDLRGHGRSDKPRDGYGMSDLLSDLGSNLDSLGVNMPIVLVGHSFGGAIATEFACAHPQRVSHLVLIATAGEFHLNPLYRALLRLPVSTLQAMGTFTRNWLGAPPPALKAMYESSLSSWNGWNLFHDLSTPTLVIRGHHDAVFKQTLFDEVARAIPISEEVDVGASGHMVMLERREAVNRAITRFVESGQTSFSSEEASPEGTRRTRLLEECPWLRYYEEGIPYTIAVPRIPLHSFLESSARRFPHKPALIFEGTQISYQRLNKESNRFAQYLLGLGIRKGERVMILLPNIPQLVIAYFGTLKSGAAAVFTIPTTQPEELIRQIEDSGADVLVTLDQFHELISRIKMELISNKKSPLKKIIVADLADYMPVFKRAAFRLSSGGGTLRQVAISQDEYIALFNKILSDQSSEAPEIEIMPRDLAVIHYTGGTTAQPKGVMLSQQNLVANALQTRQWLPDVQEGNERFLSVLPFSHSYGLTAGLNVPVALGAALILKARFDVLDILNTIRNQHPTIFPGVPQMYVALRDYPGVRKYGISSIKACISGSAPLPVEVQESFEKLTRGRVVEGYGLTEASPVTHANPLQGMRKVGTIGIPLPSTQARVVGLRHRNQVVPVGQIGELAVRGPQVMMGYWDNPSATKAVLSTDGWLLTGDVAQMDSDGYFRIIARKADMWFPTRPGKPAFPRDVEEVLFEVPQVKEAAVVAIAGQPIAFVIARQDKPTSEALIAYCQRRLHPDLVPKLVIFVDEFPRTFIGKVLRRELARLFEESRKAGNA